MTLREALAEGVATLASNPSLVTPAKDAELLLLVQLAIDKAQRFAHPDRSLTDEEIRRYRQSLRRRAAGEPIQYITGQQEFYGLNFCVTPAVLIPRPETEHLVEAVLERLPGDQPMRILDVGTGSGILAVTLALHCPSAEITAVDISSEAIAVARQNAEGHRVSPRIRFLESDLLAAVRGEDFDAIVSNPPYIPESDRAALHPQVREFEPARALFAAEDGLGIYKRLIPQAYAALKSDGLLAMEFGYGQRKSIAALLAGWTGVHFVKDLQGIPRVALATRP